MDKPLPRWLFKQYSNLWFKFKDKEITMKEIKPLFTNKSSGTSMTDMVECGWINRLSTGVYKLNSPDKMTEVIARAK
ncbi:hypothetical protein GQ473_03780 [archaeon]|nr:hypothetical protein [archaeon]